MLAEGLPDGDCFEFVVVGCRGSMGVDVAHFLRLNPGIADRLLHHSDCARACFVGHGQMKGVRCHTVPDQFRVDSRAAPFGQFELFQDQNARAFADNKSIPVAFKRTGRVLRIVVASRKRSHRGESSDAHRRDRRFSSAANHYVRITTLNDLETISDSMGACRTGCSSRRIRSLGSIANRNLARSQIDDRRNYKEWRNAVWSFIKEFGVLPLDGPEIADAATDISARVLSDV